MQGITRAAAAVRAADQTPGLAQQRQEQLQRPAGFYLERCKELRQKFAAGGGHNTGGRGGDGGGDLIKQLERIGLPPPRSLDPSDSDDDGQGVGGTGGVHGSPAPLGTPLVQWPARDVDTSASQPKMYDWGSTGAAGGCGR